VLMPALGRMLSTSSPPITRRRAISPSRRFAGRRCSSATSVAGASTRRPNEPS
jgi:hypothetical protein